MNILIITNFFYPRNHIASFRMEAYAKYLHLAGHKIYVITEGDRDETNIWEGCNVFYVKERINLRHLNFYNTDSVIWHKIKAGINYINNHLFLDIKANWRKEATKKALKTVREYAIDIVLSSYGYLSSHLIALKIKKSNKIIRWFADFRDEMSTSPSFSKIICYRLRKIEKRILDNVDLVMAVSKPIIDDLKKNSNHNDSFIELNNGYDFEEFRENNNNQFFTLSYIGNFYGNRKPDNLLYALENLKEEKKLPSNFLLKIIGNLMPLNIPDGIHDNIIQKERVPHNQAINEMKASDVLLLIHPSSEQKGIYTGKIFEYLAINKYILALVDTSDVAAQLIILTNSGIAVEYSDIDKIKEAICILYDQWKNKIPPMKKWDIIEMYSRKNQVQKLVDFLNKNGE